MSYIKSGLFLFSLLLSTVVFAPLVSVVYYLLFMLSTPKRRAAAHYVATYWGKAIVLLTPGWKVRVEGTENLERNKKYVFVANHESATDIFVMYFTNLQFRWLSKASMFKIPLIGSAMKSSGYIPVERGNKKSHVEALRRSVEVVNSYVPMLYFPEGTRSKTGELNQFKVGAFKLAKDTGAEIVPICLIGTKDLLKKGSISPGKASVTVKFLPPTNFLDGESVEECASRVRSLISNHRA